MRVRSFLYLDEYKLYSYSSQLFSGLTEYVVEYSGREQGHASQRQLNDAAKTVAEIARERTGSEEKRFLHDHAYNLFERELESRGALAGLDDLATPGSLERPQFIRVSGKAVFLDAPMLTELIERFNELSTAVAYVSTMKTRQDAERHLQDLKATVTDRNRKRLVAEAAKSIAPEAIARASGMHQDPALLKQLTTLMKYGFGDQFQLQIEQDNLVYSAVLSRKSLRESEAAIVQKYARQTDRAITIVGIPTQAPGAHRKAAPSDSTHTQMKAVLMELVARFSEVETSLSGRLENEVIIDPVAAYVEVEVPDSSRASGTAEADNAR